jgi:hypothetical protein
MRWIVKWALGVIQRSDLTIAERTACIGAVLEKLEALPLKDIVSSSEDGVLINNKPVDIDKLRVLRESAIQALDNQAFNLIGEQVVWIAIQRGIHNADTPEKLYFYRAAIWFSEQVKAHLQVLAQQGIVGE